MSEIKDGTMSSYVTMMTQLRNQFIDQYKKTSVEADKEIANGILRQMHILHGHAIYKNYLEKKSIESDLSHLTDENSIKLSVDASLLNLMQNLLRSCIKMLDHTNKIYTENISTDTQSKLSLSPRQSPSKISQLQLDGGREVKIVSKPDNVEELSLGGIINQSDFQPSMISEKFFTEKKMGGARSSEISVPIDQDGMTDYIQNIGTSEAARMLSDYEKDYDQNGGSGPYLTVGENVKIQAPMGIPIQMPVGMPVGMPMGMPVGMSMGMPMGMPMSLNNPTLINYWADWCGHSRQFLPIWKAFKEAARQRYPQLQVTELNIGRNRELEALAREVGVMGYPSVVFLHGGNVHHMKDARTLENIGKFVDSVMNK